MFAALQKRKFVRSAASVVLRLSLYSLRVSPPLSFVVVCCGNQGHLQATQNVTAWVRQMAQRGARIRAFSTGTWSLAKAGLLTDRRCTFHWEDQAAFNEHYSDCNLSNELFETNRQVFTCSGGTAVVDLFFNIRHGAIWH